MGLRARHVIAGSPVEGADLTNQIVDGLVARLQIYLRGLDDEERGGRIVKEKVLIGLVQLAKVVGRRKQRGALRILLTVIQAFEQDVGGRLQIDDQVGRGNVRRQQVIESLIDEQFVIVEVQVREDLVA